MAINNVLICRLMTMFGMIHWTEWTSSVACTSLFALTSWQVEHFGHSLTIDCVMTFVCLSGGAMDDALKPSKKGCGTKISQPPGGHTSTQLW